MFSSRIIIRRVINGMPKSIKEPHGVTIHSAAILVPVPTIVSVRPVLYREYSMSEARFSEGRVLRLRLSHSAETMSIQIFHSTDDESNGKKKLQ